MIVREPVDWFSHIPERYNKKTFLIHSQSGVEISFLENHKRALAVRHLLLQRNYAPEDRIAILGHNSVDMAPIFLGGLYAGVTVVPLYFGSTQREITTLVENAKVKSLWVERSLKEKLHLGETIGPRISIQPLEGFTESFSRTTSSFETMRPLHPEDPFLIVHTSGTTATPKGVIHTLYNLVQNGRVMGETLHFSSKDRFYNLFPMSYLGGCHNLLLIPYVWGASVVIASTFSAQSLLNFWREVMEYEINVLWLNPTVLAWLLRLDRGKEARDYCRKKVRFVLCGMAPLPLSLKQEFESRYGIPILQNYGLSETLFLTTNAPDEPTTGNSVGKPLPEVELRIQKTDGENVPCGEEGEILVRTPYKMKHYFGDPTMSHPSGWFPTGDKGYLNEKGELFISGRKKDIIIRGGVNISPAAIENVISNCPGVVECAVVGRSHPVMGEEIVAVVQHKEGIHWPSLQKEIQSQCKSLLPTHMRPAQIIEMSELPHTLSGKIKKNEIREWVASAVSKKE